MPKAGSWTLLARVHRSIVDCPRTADEVAADTGYTRDYVAKAISTLMRQRRVAHGGHDPDNHHQIYEASD